MIGNHREDEVSRFNPLGAPLKDSHNQSLMTSIKSLGVAGRVILP